MCAASPSCSSRFQSLILSHHSRLKITCECNEEDINDDDDAAASVNRQPLSSKNGTYKKVKARFWPWRPGQLFKLFPRRSAEVLWRGGCRGVHHQNRRPCRPPALRVHRHLLETPSIVQTLMCVWTMLGEGALLHQNFPPHRPPEGRRDGGRHSYVFLVDLCLTRADQLLIVGDAKYRSIAANSEG